MLKTLQKVRYQLYKAHFVFKTNANVLVAQLNRLVTDLLGLLVTRWIAYIRLFNFKVQHILEKKNIAADRLSRQLQTELDDINKVYKQDIDNFVKAELRALLIVLIQAEEVENSVATKNIFKDRYLDNLQRIV